MKILSSKHLFGLLVLVFLNACSQPDELAGTYLPNPYARAESSFGQLPPGREWGAVSAIHYAGDGTLWVAERCGGNRGPGSCEDRLDVDPILLLDTEGNVLRSFGAGLFVWPHGIFVDADKNLWVTDAATAREGRKGNQVHKFSPEGELLMSLGIPGVVGNGHYYFVAPNDVLVAPNGDIFVADGHNGVQGNRIVKYDRDGVYITQWGGTGAEGGGVSSSPCTCDGFPRTIICSRPRQ